MEAVERLVADWPKLAHYLGVRNDDVKVMKTEKPGDTWACLHNTMELWLRENYNTTKFGHPSWRTLVKAVARMDMAHAKEIANEHRGIYLTSCENHRAWGCISVCMQPLLHAGCMSWVFV